MRRTRVPFLALPFLWTIGLSVSPAFAQLPTSLPAGPNAATRPPSVSQGGETIIQVGMSPRSDAAAAECPPVVLDECESANETERRPPRCWISAQYLLWWIKDGPVVPLVTTSPTGTAVGTAGVLGQPDTTVLFGDSDIDYGMFSGGRLSLGRWCDPERAWGLQASLFFLAERSESFAAGSDTSGSPIVARPIISALSDTELAQLVAFPNAFAGNVAVTSLSRLMGAELNLLQELVPRCNVHFLFGFLFLELNENLRMTQDSTVLPQGVVGFNGLTLVPGDRLVLLDQFDGRNQFYGGQAGLVGEHGRGRLLFDWAVKFGIGSTLRETTIQGGTLLFPLAGEPASTSGGLYALASNSGRHHDEEYTFTFHTQARLRYLIGQRLTVGVGYDFLWWDNVARPGNQIDRTIDPRQLPTSVQFVPGATAVRPDGSIHDKGFWAQGLAFELGLRY
jgi:hypothetical protein